MNIIIKNITYIFVAASLMVLSSSFTDAPLPPNTTHEAVAMDNSVTTSIRRSATPPREMVITNINRTLKIDFLSTIGGLDIAVYNEIGNIAHKSNVNAIAGESTIINVRHLSDGEYTLVITNIQNGRSAKGHFTLTTDN